MNATKERPQSLPTSPTQGSPGSCPGTRRRRRKPDPLRRRLLPLFLLCLIIVVVAVNRLTAADNALAPSVKKMARAKVPGWVQVNIIEVDGASRRGEKLENFTDVVVHYVGNPGTSARQNRDFYASPDSDVSSHFLVGLEGEIIQCIPLDEKSSATSWRNSDTISIEVCHPDDTGAFTQASYDALVRLTAWLLETGGLTQDHVIRHYDVTGKECPRYYVAHEDAWTQFRADVAAQ